ncbi:3-oxoacyl-[acyl-carrier protein] reductase [Aurantimicrobium minutum]|nr:3-oxoacyl-[acyl-carrier protein] reductase [Aurantimicrobium minutum]
MSMEMFQAHGRTVLVIGGLGGLGRGICTGFISAGADVIALDTDSEKETLYRVELDAMESQLSVICADATTPEAYELCLEHVASRGSWIDTVVVCATPPQFTKAIEDYDWDYHQQMTEVFLKIPYLATRALLPAMKEHSFGRIINITSEVFEMSEPHSSAYVAGKGAQIGWTRSMAKELAPFGITVNHVAPGFIPVERHQDLPQEVFDDYLATVPANRFGTPADIGSACVYFASAEAGFVTGQTLIVNGGRSPH